MIYNPAGVSGSLSSSFHSRDGLFVVKRPARAFCGRIPEHHFRWLKDNDADVITAGKLDDFFTVADEFSLLAEDLDPELEEELEESVIIP